MTVVTRFAPSPTGFLHIGGARTALFNWLYARRMGGKYLLRIEDTDRARSTDENLAKLAHGLQWLDLWGDEEPVFQHANLERHVEIARMLLAEGKAYRCYCSPEALREMRERARAQGRTALYDNTWRDRDPAEAPAGVDPVVRLKTPLDGETVIEDLVQGRVAVRNADIDDFVLLRADGTPTYMHSVVVDDHDMGVTHVIRGDDHLNNAFRQAQLFRAMGWAEPRFAHIPLIHGPDGAKLSKRHGALGVEAYREMGYLPEALCNHLLRLGWSHGDDEVIDRGRAAEWFGLEAVGRAPARFDTGRLDSLNAHYIREAGDGRLADTALDWLRRRLVRELTPEEEDRARRGIAGAKAAGQDARRPRRRIGVLRERATGRIHAEGRETAPGRRRARGAGGRPGGGRRPRRLDGGRGRGGGPRARRTARRQAGRGGAAAARRAYRLPRLAGDFRGHGDPRPRGDAGPRQGGLPAARQRLDWFRGGGPPRPDPTTRPPAGGRRGPRTWT